MVPKAIRFCPYELPYVAELWPVVVWSCSSSPFIWFLSFGFCKATDVVVEGRKGEICCSRHVQKQLPALTICIVRATWRQQEESTVVSPIQYQLKSCKDCFVQWFFLANENWLIQEKCIVFSFGSMNSQVIIWVLQPFKWFTKCDARFMIGPQVNFEKNHWTT